MPERLFRLYQRKRVININVNAVVAGIVSTILVVGLIWVLKHWFHAAWPTWGYTAFSVGADLVLDVAIFTGLHWLANHWRPARALGSGREKLELGAAAPPHLEDATRVQIERAILSPLYYLIAAAGTEGLQRLGLHPSAAVMVAYPVGLAVTRTLHTLWGARSGSFVDHHVRERKERIRRRREARSRRSRGGGPEAA